MAANAAGDREEENGLMCSFIEFAEETSTDLLSSSFFLGHRE